MKENYHTHTTRCRHALGSEEEYIQHAIDHKLTTLGFADHTPYLFLGTYYSTFRMYPHQIQDYAETILKLKEKYADQIEIRLGLEVEYYPDRLEDMLELIKPHGIEYMILGQHFCGNEQDSFYSGTPTDSTEKLQQYCDQVIAAMDTNLFSYVAHPDLICFTGDPDTYRQHMTRLCQAAKDRHIPLEINLLGLREQRHYPNETLLQIAGEIGCSMVLGSDAHRPEHVTDAITEARALELVKKYNVPLLEHIPIHPYRRSALAK